MILLMLLLAAALLPAGQAALPDVVDVAVDASGGGLDQLEREVLAVGERVRGAGAVAGGAAPLRRVLLLAPRRAVARLRPLDDQRDVIPR